MIKLYAVRPSQYTNETANDVVIRTYPIAGDFVVGTFEVEPVPAGTTIYNSSLTAYEPFVQPGWGGMR